jgi:hypothetical protein
MENDFRAFSKRLYVKSLFRHFELDSRVTTQLRNDI